MLGAVSTAFSVIAVIITAIIAWLVFQGQKKLSQRQLIIPLWKYLSNIREIDPEKPIASDVINLVNTLELVAICCEGGMVDEDVIRRTFSDGFIHHSDAILKINSNIQGLGKDGKTIFKENKSAYQFYRKLTDEYYSTNKLAK
ncbi:DUF4760 domain-containing protein [Photobacterium damselae]|uniref:DUF4760 domain-containing protein n=1 Tax=Photobacterium damselae TaxID=38293 RepID=UPI001484E7DE|nr:DUF4760 domain-containing protein [Photobacterium damselae]